jgi:hypothetical protein
LQNVFLSVFELFSLRNIPKREKQKVEEQLTSKFLSVVFEKVFDMNFLLKHFNGVFELPYRKLPKNVLKKNKKKRTRLVGGSGI